MSKQPPTSGYSCTLSGEQAMVQFGAKLGHASQGGGIIYLEGDLGAGKTTLSRGVLYGLGHQGAVKSPTYTLVEPYELDHQNVYHFDLYRLGDPEELEYMGIRDYFVGSNLCLVEWPERAGPLLPRADLIVRISALKNARAVRLEAQTAVGEAIVHHLQQ
jgi:tRNA threonylcarbamoyladenosine biosynthesis protein TsaE